MRWRRTPLRLEEAGPASVDEVWRRYTTPALWAGWVPGAVWTPTVGPVRVRMRHGVDRLGKGSRAWVEIDAPRPLALPYAPIARLALRRLVAA